MNQETETKFVNERAMIELTRVKNRKLLKEEQKRDLKDFDIDTRRQISKWKERLDAALKAPAEEKEKTD
jgi:hypothetical protein